MRTLIFAALVAITAPAALAHELAQGTHGGPVVDAGSYHLEMVTEDTVLTIYVTDAEGRPVPTADVAGARAVLQGAAGNAIVPLSGSDGDRLQGALAAPFSGGERVVVSATLGGEAVQARFVAP